MPRYIDADNKEALEKCSNQYPMVSCALNAYFPTEDVEPIVHAHWIHRTRDHRNDYYDVMEYPYRCSACRVKNKELTKRCPECGARMDDEV